MTGRSALRLLLLVTAALALAALAFAGPRFRWANDGLILDYPWTQPAAAACAAAVAAAAACVPGPRALRAAAAVLGVVLLWLGASRLVFRVEIVESGVHERSLLGRVRLGWGDLARVEPRPGATLLVSRDGRSVQIATRRVAPEDRNRLERTIARRLTEAAR